MQGIGEGIGDALVVLMLICLVSVPLGIWKLVELIIWAYSNVSVSVGN